MKKHSIVIAAMLLLFSCKKTSESEQKFNSSLSGTIANTTSGKLYLERLIDSTLMVVDSVSLDGKSDFAFYFDLEDPEMIYIYYEKDTNIPIEDGLSVFMEQGEITLNTSIENFYQDAVVTGSANHDKLVEYQKLMKRFQDKNLDLIRDMYLAEKDNDAEKILEINRQYQSLMTSKYMGTVNFALNNNDFEISPYLALYEVFDINTKYLDTIYNGLTPKVKSSTYGKLLEKYIVQRKELN